MEKLKKFTIDALKSDQQIRWCAGCGNNAIITAVLRTLPELGLPREQFVFISGIGCSSRFPYYMNTYGFHGIHGRALSIATGTKIANPKLSVWVITGDGDSMAIGGNHFIHAVRRNIDLNVLILNNQIYGLTKGQFSPTSDFGSITKTSPFGTIENPFNPGRLTLGARGRFFARVPDNNLPLMQEVFKAAARHNGTSVVEILQNCVIFNDKTHAAITDKKVKDEKQIILKHGEPMIFGKNRDKGIVLNKMNLEVLKIGQNGHAKNEMLYHNIAERNIAFHSSLAKMHQIEGMPMAMGIIRSIDDLNFNDKIYEQINEVKKTSDIKCADDLFNSGNTWEID